MLTTCDRCRRALPGHVVALEIDHGDLHHPEKSSPRFRSSETTRFTLCQPCGSEVARWLQDIIGARFAA